MIHHPSTVHWDTTLKQIFDEIDDYLEHTYGDLYHLRPNRPARGETSNKEHDGLFNVGSSFSAGFGSSLGRGFVVSVHLSTLQPVESAVYHQIMEVVIQLLREKLPERFPGRELKVDWDGDNLKIHGDLSLGEL